METKKGLSERRITPAEDKNFIIEMTKEECKALAAQYGFDAISSLRGSFVIHPDNKIVSCYFLKGVVDAVVIDQKEEIVLSELISLYLIKNEEDLEKFSLEDDVEILNGDGTVEITDIMGQYVYLAVMEVE